MHSFIEFQNAGVFKFPSFKGDDRSIGCVYTFHKMIKHIKLIYL